MIIGIDIRVLARGTRTGIEEYTSNLLSFLLPLDQEIKYKLFYNAFKKINLDYSWLNLPNVELKSFRFPNRFFFILARYLNIPKIDKLLKGVDLYFNPHFFVTSLSQKCKRVMTFHDLSFKRYPEYFSRRKRLWQKFLMNAEKEAKKADKIIADSQSTKEDLIKIYKINPEKIKVVYSGVSEDFKPSKKAPISIPTDVGTEVGKPIKKVRKKYSLPENFILYFGTIEPRKNLISVIKAFEILKKENTLVDLKLVIAGTKGWLYKDIFKAVKDSKYKEDILFTGFIEDKDKPYLYNLANVFVYPSFFEGFGFPPIEAMACGIPTIVSNASSLPEVVGNGAIMVDPRKASELAFAIKEVLEDKELRESLIKRGLKQAKKFNWNKTAKEVLEIFKELK